MGHEIEPCFLVASPSLTCPFFNHTVVLLVDHREDGSLGFVVNKQADLDLGKVLTDVGLDISAPLDAPVMFGGPVAPETGWVLFDPGGRAYTEEGMLRLGDRIGVSANMDVLEQIASGQGPDHFMMMLGYAGWGPGQLDDEIRDGSWIPVDLDAELIFGVSIEDRWATGLAKLGIDPARVAGTVVAEA